MEEQEFDRARAEQAEDLANAIAAVEKQALDDSQLDSTLASLLAESATVSADFYRTQKQCASEIAKRDALRLRLDETQKLWKLRQAELKVAMVKHEATTAAAKSELQQIREVEEAADGRRRAAKAEVKGLESKVNEVRDRCSETQKAIDAAKARAQKNRRAGEQCEAEMRRIAAEHARAQEAFSASVKRRQDLEDRLVALQGEHKEEELRLNSQLQAVEKRHEDLQVRETNASGGIAEVEAEMAASKAAARKVIAKIEWEQGAADVMLQEATDLLKAAKEKLAAAESDKRRQVDQSAAVLGMLEEETEAWNTRRDELLAPLNKLEAEIASHEELVESLPRRRIECVRATVDAENGIRIATDMGKKVEIEISGLEDKCARLSKEIEVATAAADSDDYVRAQTDSKRESTCQAHDEWKEATAASTAALGPATAKLVIVNTEASKSYCAWHEVLVQVKAQFATILKEYMDCRAKTQDTQRLLITQIRVRNSLRTLYRRAAARKSEQAAMTALGDDTGADETTLLRRLVTRLAKVADSRS